MDIDEKETLFNEIRDFLNDGYSSFEMNDLKKIKKICIKVVNKKPIQTPKSW